MDETPSRIGLIELGLRVLAELIRRRAAQLLDPAAPAPEAGLAERLAPVQLIPQRHLDFPEQIALLAALAPHVRPELFDRTLAEVLPTGGDFPEMGGQRGNQFRGFLPTGDTLLFLLAGNALERRLELHRLFAEGHWFARENFLDLDAAARGEPVMSGRLVLSSEALSLLTIGSMSRPRFSLEFPAERLETAREWSDLVLNPQTLGELGDLRTWLDHRHVLLREWGMGRVLRPGYRALFHGPPGTGKTLTATLLGKITGRDLYRIDLSAVVSKFIGETEKNLEKVFSKAENKDWVLFFDEADAIFGKRTGVRDAHDRYANQEVSYLLQRVEQFSGMVILASNYKNNIDSAFLRRFQSVIHFPKPGVDERQRIWRGLIPEPIRLDPALDLAAICRRHELTGSNITNVMQHCLLQTAARGDRILSAADVQTAVEREFQKEGRTL